MPYIPPGTAPIRPAGPSRHYPAMVLWTIPSLVVPGRSPACWPPSSVPGRCVGVGHATQGVHYRGRSLSGTGSSRSLPSLVAPLQKVLFSQESEESVINVRDGTIRAAPIRVRRHPAVRRTLPHRCIPPSSCLLTRVYHGCTLGYIHGTTRIRHPGACPASARDSALCPIRTEHLASLRWALCMLYLGSSLRAIVGRRQVPA